MLARRRPPALNFSGTTETDGNLSRFEDDRHLAAALGKLQHALESLFVLEHIQIGEGNLAASEGLPGPGGVRSQVLAKNYDFVIHFLLPRFIPFLSKISAQALNCK
jgi:hypothetical protein